MAEESSKTCHGTPFMTTDGECDDKSKTSDALDMSVGNLGESCVSCGTADWREGVSSRTHLIDVLKRPQQYGLTVSPIASQATVNRSL